MKEITHPISEKKFTDMGWSLRAYEFVQFADGRIIGLTLVIDKSTHDVITVYPSYNQIGADFSNGLIARYPLIKVGSVSHKFERPVSSSSPLYVYSEPIKFTRYTIPKIPKFPVLERLQKSMKTINSWLQL